MEIWPHVLGLCGLEVNFTFPVSSSVEQAGSFTGPRLTSAVRRQTEIGHHEIMTSKAASSVSPPSRLSSTLPPPQSSPSSSLFSGVSGGTQGEL